MTERWIVDKSQVTPLAKILLASLPSRTEQETQAVIDGLQEKGWNVVWGIGPTAFCSEKERQAFTEDLNAILASFEIGGMA